MHGNTKHSYAKVNSRTYRIWKGMRNRCNNKNNKDYKYYGGRGIKIDSCWNNFMNFLRDMGQAPENMTLDRVNNDKDYCKNNCKWSTRKEQANNRRTRGSSRFNGVSKKGNKWIAQATVEGKSKYIGMFRYEEDAAKAYNEYVIMNKLNRKLNF